MWRFRKKRNIKYNFPKDDDEDSSLSDLSELSSDEADDPPEQKDKRKPAQKKSKKKIDSSELDSEDADDPPIHKNKRKPVPKKKTKEKSPEFVQQAISDISAVKKGPAGAVIYTRDFDEAFGDDGNLEEKLRESQLIDVASLAHLSELNRQCAITESKLNPSVDIDCMLPNNIIDFFMKIKRHDYKSIKSCVKCDYKSKDVFKIMTHILRHKVWICRFCTKSFTDIIKFKCHVQEHTAEFGYYCSYCLSSRPYSFLEKHTKLDHPDIADDLPCTFEVHDYVLYGYLCTTCGIVKLTKCLAQHHIQQSKNCKELERINMSRLISRQGMSPKFRTLKKFYEKLRADRHKVKNPSSEDQSKRLTADQPAHSSVEPSSNLNDNGVDDNVSRTIEKSPTKSQPDKVKKTSKSLPPANNVDSESVDASKDVLKRISKRKPKETVVKKIENTKNSHRTDKNKKSLGSEEVNPESQNLDANSIANEEKCSASDGKTKQSVAVEPQRKKFKSVKKYNEMQNNSNSDYSTNITIKTEYDETIPTSSDCAMQPTVAIEPMKKKFKSVKKYNEMQNNSNFDYSTNITIKTEYDETIPTSSDYAMQPTVAIEPMKKKFKSVEKYNEMQNNSHSDNSTNISIKKESEEPNSMNTTPEKEKSIVCPQCSITSSTFTESSLTLHLFEDFGIKPYSCGLCKKVFEDLNKFELHTKEVQRCKHAPYRLTRCPKYISKLVKSAFSPPCSTF